MTVDHGRGKYSIRAVPPGGGAGVERVIASDDDLRRRGGSTAPRPPTIPIASCCSVMAAGSWRAAIAATTCRARWARRHGRHRLVESTSRLERSISRELSTWRQLSGLLKRVAEGQQDPAEVVTSLRIVLQLVLGLTSNTLPCDHAVQGCSSSVSVSNRGDHVPRAKRRWTVQAPQTF